jgi:hypothetical protein
MPASMSASWTSGDFDAYHTHNGYNGGVHFPDELPACDLWSSDRIASDNNVKLRRLCVCVR